MNENDGKSTINNCGQVIKEYEILNEILKCENEQYKIEQRELRREILYLIKENKQISIKLNEVLQDYQPKELENNLNEEVIDNLKKQLNSCLKEKEHVFNLWQNSLNVIDKLEEKLNFTKESDNYFVHKSEVEKLIENQKEELEELQGKHKLINDSLEEHNKKLKHVEEENKIVKTENKKIKNELADLKQRLYNALLEKKNLEEEIKKKNEETLRLIENNRESKMKIVEAVSVAETAILKESQTQDENLRLTMALSNLLKENEEKIKKEVDQVKVEYNNKIHEAIDDLKEAQNILKSKNLELDKVNRECEMVKKELQDLKNIVNDDNTTKVLMLQKKYESTFQKLLLSERQNVQLNSERESIKMDLEQMANSFERQIKTFEVEKCSLEKQLGILRKELGKSNHLTSIYRTNIDELNQQLDILKNKLNKTIHMNEKTYKKKMEDKIREIQTENDIIQNELKAFVETERKLNKKWKNEMKYITKKFQKHIETLKDQNHELKQSLRQYKNDNGDNKVQARSHL